MFKKALIALFSVGLMTLGGCVGDATSPTGAILSSTVSPQIVQTADSAVDLAISAATSYIMLPVCSAKVTPPCRTVAGKMALEKDVAAARIARNNMKALLRANNGGPIPVVSFDTAKSVFDTIEADVAVYTGK